MGDIGRWPRNDRPGNGMWDNTTGITFVQAMRWIEKYRDDNLPISREMIALFFFHETCFCSMTQAGGGPGVGLGQLEVLNRRSDKPAFLRSLGLAADQALVDRIVANPEYSVELQCAYYRAKRVMGVTTEGGMLNAQIGAEPPNSFMKPKFITAERELRSVLFSGSRERINNALNACRWYVNEHKDGIVQRPVTLDRYRRYWDFTLPSGDLALSFRT